jgi:glycosyltransferase involved in cell wall biosynthesis
MSIVFWQNILSILQSAPIRALASKAGIDVTLVVSQPVPPWRKQLGWSKPDFGKADIIIGPSEKQINKLLDTNTSETIHIFNTISGHPLPAKVLSLAVNRQRRIGIQAEPSVFRGFLGCLRTLRGQWNQRRFGEEISFILAIGRLAEVWFELAGYRSSKIAPYAYFVERDSAGSQTSPLPNERPVRFLYLGQLIPRKGLDTLFFALSKLSNPNWILSLIGDGANRKYYSLLTEVLGVSDRIDFRGALPHSEAMSAINQHDYLLLPSRWDGWGAVTGEALIRGTPAIVSHRCGSATLIDNAALGDIFQAENICSLRNSIQCAVDQGPITYDFRQQVRGHYENYSGDAAANYLLDVISAAEEGRQLPSPTWPYYSRRD